MSKKAKHARKPIPAATREQLWHTWFGDSGRELCPICAFRDVTPFDFEAGHKIPDSKGGSAKIDNLVPMCRACNRSMGAKNIAEYMRENGLRLRTPRAKRFACCALM